MIPSDNAGRAISRSAPNGTIADPSWLPRRPADEPGPDAMRWTPDVADAEIAAWQQILHPQQAQ